MGIIAKMKAQKITKNKFHMKKPWEHWRIIAAWLMLFDVVSVFFAFYFALLLRFDFRLSAVPMEYYVAYIRFIPMYCLICIGVYFLAKLYQSIWRYASFDELNRILLANVITWFIHIIGITMFYIRMPMSYYIVGCLVQFSLCVLIRFSYRYITLERSKIAKKIGRRENIMIIGAGAAGIVLLKELKVSEEINGCAKCVIDDNPNKWGRYIEGVPVVGGRNTILENVEKYHIDKIMYAIPSSQAEDRKEILNVCNETGCELQILPGVYQFANGEISLRNMKAVAVEDLLGRDQIKVNVDEIYTYLTGKTILVTGGGGSIGSELCRQIAKHHPKQLIVFDVYENNAYEIQQELKKAYPKLNLETIIGSVRDSRKIFQVFEQYHPDIVYHAAAHKHVPLMENSPCEAIKNNAIGTYKTAYAAMVHGCKRFILISTDKAVNPTNIMGASKRLCEMIIQAFDVMVKKGRAEEIPQLFTHLIKEKKTKDTINQALRNAETEFVAVRFGNVLGSNGSVIPLFKNQIEQGGPVTVTHPDIIRYFMTIPEAVGLVLQAGTNAKGGEIFVLDMGEPVKIETLARNLIRLSGHVPDVDIKIEYTGLRPGEKLFEEKLMAEEGLKKTENELIHIGCPIPFDVDVFLLQLDDLMEAAYKNKANIRETVQSMVSTYQPWDE